MSAPQLLLDFSGRRSQGGIRGFIAAVAGALVLFAVLVHQHQLAGQRAGLELRRTAVLGAQRRAQDPTTIGGLNAGNAEKTVRELATPWSQLLAELESASNDDAGKVALLSIEPDHVKHRVKVTAEARTLELAIAYVQRLQKTAVLRFPMLDSHELKTDDKDHPVRFQVSAEWSDAS
jgi:hypothetical protein